MILLNGLPPILGATIIHITIINVFAIIVEYLIIKTRYPGKRLLVRVIIANVVSVLAGTIVMLKIPDTIGGRFGAPDTYVYTLHDKISFAVRLSFLFITNVLIETPAYFFGLKVDKGFWQLIAVIFLSNVITNIPVLLIYLLFMS